MADIKEFQLVLLYPDEEPDSLIVCDLVTISPGDEIPSFVALSYVCDKASPTTAISLNEIDCPVPETLATALCHLRDVDDGVFLWVDPLCIGTTEAKDPKEAIKENAQVYTLSREVVVWLGEETASSAAQFFAAKSLAEMMVMTGTSGIVQTLEQVLQNPSISIGLCCCQPLFNKPWWHWERIEALCHLGLGAKASFQCGRRRMMWGIFYHVVLALRFALPRLSIDYPIPLDRILLQIPGKIPERFKEVFSSSFKDATPDDNSSAWGYGPLFSHPCDVLYWISDVSESHKAGRALTALSVRLSDRYRQKRKTDQALQQWLNLLAQRAKFENDEGSYDVMQTALSWVKLQPADQIIQQPHIGDTDTYIYRPLSADSQEIRVLILYPSNNYSAEVCCDLFPLNCRYWRGEGVESLPYTALSYTWGDVNPPKFIYLGGKRKQVTPNLFEALKRLRDPYFPILLWVDAICIDQNNVEEKNHQVGMMGEIYQNAGCVMIWIDSEVDDLLGGVSGDFQLVFTVMDMFAALERVLFTPLYRVGNYSLEDQPEIKKLMDTMDGFAPFYGIKNFFHRKYWTRVWTMQEALLGRNVLLCHGLHIVSLKALEFMFVKLYRRQFPQESFTVEHQHDTTNAAQFLAIYWEMLHGNKPSLLKSLLMSRERSSTVKHDYIYAVLGLVKHSDNGPPIVPDYEREYFSVARDLFRHVIEIEDNLDVLSACEVRNQYQADPRERIRGDNPWPSWLPDWSISPLDIRTARSILFPQSNGQALFKAAGDTRPKISFLADEALLFIQGMIVDKIDCVVDFNPLQIVHLKKYWDILSKAANVRSAYGSTQDMLHAFNNAICLGQPTTRLWSLHLDDDEIKASQTSANEASAEVTPDADHEDKNYRENFIGKWQSDVKCAGYISRFFVTGLGYIGRGALPLEEGDILVVFYGAKVPHLLKKIANSEFYRLVGECYVDGIMQGEYMERPDIEIRNFTLR